MTVKKADNELTIICKSLEWSKAMYLAMMHLMANGGKNV
jgi:hypothetical protein